jgi:hypothetical protein
VSESPPKASSLGSCRSGNQGALSVRAPPNSGLLHLKHSVASFSQTPRPWIYSTHNPSPHPFPSSLEPRLKDSSFSKASAPEVSAPPLCKFVPTLRGVDTCLQMVPKTLTCVLRCLHLMMKPGPPPLWLVLWLPAWSVFLCRVGEAPMPLTSWAERTSLISKPLDSCFLLLNCQGVWRSRSRVLLLVSGWASAGFLSLQPSRASQL